ncbi:SHOCT-like domain-containing protein [Desulfosporosinus sp. SB140]|uniref:SHOCT-like domain-containing protein n=1 Tax=Desulfosporosinus paludis TaxID=3115649 RepID=UPI003890DE58
MSSEKMKILEMIQEGKLTASEGMDLLKAMEEGTSFEKVSPNPEFDLVKKEVAGNTSGDRFLRVRVLGEKSLKVNVNVPLSLIRSASKLVVYAMSFVPADKRAELEQKGIDLQALDVEELVRLVEETVDGKIVDVEVADPQEGRIKVEVCVE